jgi:glutamyl-tRNA synthetase
METSDTFYISKADADTLEKDEVFRLKDLFDVEVTEKGKAIEGSYAGDEKVGKRFQWVGDERTDCEILVPGDLLRGGEFNPESLKTVKGLCERNCAKLEPGTLIQFERFGFVRLDRKEKDKLTFVFAC